MKIVPEFQDGISDEGIGIMHLVPENSATAETGGGRYTVGTLTYSRATLIKVFFWMLWGDFCVQLMEAVIPRLVPLQLKDLGASDTALGMITGSIPAAIYFIINPFISTYSDRYRSRLGRRRPFILYCTPILVMMLLALGYSESIAAGASGVIQSMGVVVGAKTVAIGVIAVFLGLFTFFNIVVLATYYYLFQDVIPQQVIGKFTCFYRVVISVAQFVFNRWLLGYAETPHTFDLGVAHLTLNREMIYLGSGVIYLFAFLLLVWQVKEGAYPEPAQKAARRAEGAVTVYLKECFSISFYLKLYLIGALYYVATIPVTTYNMFYATRTLGMSLEEFGSIMGWAALLSVGLYFVLGPLADRFHPLRLVIVGHLLILVTSALCFVFIHDARTFYYGTMIHTIATTTYLGGQISLFFRTFPREKFGQYASANSMVTAAAQFVTPIATGALLDWAANYRLIYLLSAVGGAAGVAASVMTYAHWKRLGGDEAYTPPEVETAKVTEAAEGELAMITETR